MLQDKTQTKLVENKTVFVRERKRHTDRRLSSTPCAVLYLGEGVVPRADAPLAGVPPPSAGVDWQTKWNYYLLSRTTYAVGNNWNMYRICGVWHLEYVLITPKICACFSVKDVKYYFCM